MPTSEPKPPQSKLISTPQEVQVIEATSSGMNNYPYSVEQATRELLAYLQSQLGNGWVYHGTIARDIGVDTRYFYVFYK